jgi:dUTP pyrophosphatase
MSVDTPIVRCVGDSAELPEYQSPGASGADLRARLDAELVVAPGARVLVPTGLRLEIPTGLEGQVRPRSGLAARSGLTVLNTPGTIDSDYRGEIKVILVNLGDEEVRIRNGDRIAQIVFCPVVRVSFSRQADIAQTSRGSGGFGSTGV